MGPDSAGANPGPASYRRGGPLAVTDANVMLGKIQPEHFPHVVGADGRQALDAAVVREKFAALARTIAGCSASFTISRSSGCARGSPSAAAWNASAKPW